MEGKHCLALKLASEVVTAPKPTQSHSEVVKNWRLLSDFWPQTPRKKAILSRWHYMQLMAIIV